jgi:Tfp pilus assembly protein PilF
LTRDLRALEDWEGLAEVLALEAAHAPRTSAAPLFIELAQLYLERLGQPGPGEAALRRVITLDQGNVAARQRLAQLVGARGEFTEAVALLEAAAAHLDPVDGAACLREAAQLARQLGDPSLELKLLRRAHGLAPATDEALERLAEALYLQGAVDEALPLQRALAATASFDENPELTERVLLRLADLAEQSGDRALATQALRRVVHERPLNGDAVDRLATLIGRDEPRAALELRARHLESLGASVRTVDRLLALAREAAAQRELELAVRLLRRAALVSAEPLPVRLELLTLLRQAGRVAELMTELAEVAQLQVTLGQVDDALLSWDEEARLAEGNGLVDDALRTLKAMAQLCEEEGRAEAGASFAERRVLLLRDTKLDLDGAALALEEAWVLAPTLERARLGSSLAQRRSDHDGELDWLERTLHLVPPAEQPALFVQLGRLHLGLPGQSDDVAQAPMLAPDQAEAALRHALELNPSVPSAEGLLLGLLEREDRVADVAAWYEETAARAREPRPRAEALLKAAAVYRDRAGRPHEAAAALLAARAADPDDLSLTARVADLLVSLGRRQDAADFDGLLLEADPFHPSFERHAAWLAESADELALAGLLSRRAERETEAVAAARWLAAATAFHRAGAAERAQLCEAQAFDASPDNQLAFTQLFAAAAGDARRQAELLLRRARAVPGEASALLRQRADLLSTHDPLVAAVAWDDYLALVPDDFAAPRGARRAGSPWGGARGAALRPAIGARRRRGQLGNSRHVVVAPGAGGRREPGLARRRRGLRAGRRAGHGCPWARGAHHAGRNLRPAARRRRSVPHHAEGRRADHWRRGRGAAAARRLALRGRAPPRVGRVGGAAAGPCLRAGAVREGRSGPGLAGSLRRAGRRARALRHRGGRARRGRCVDGRSHVGRARAARPGPRLRASGRGHARRPRQPGGRRGGAGRGAPPQRRGAHRGAAAAPRRQRRRDPRQ